MSDRREGAAAAKAPDAEPKIPPMFTDAQLRRLKAAVIIMGVILLLGFGLVIFRIMHLLGRAGPPPGGQPPVTATGASTAPRPDVALDLPAGAVVRTVSQSGDRLMVHYDAPSGGGIAVVDLATGAVQRVRFGQAPR